MCRKLAVTALVVIGLLATVRYTRVGSYVNLAWTEASASVANSVPVEVEIARLKEEVKKLLPDLNKNIALVANEMAVVERIEREINTTRTNLGEQKVRLVQMANWIESGESQFIINSKVYSKEQVAQHMARDFDAYKRADSELKFRERELTLKKKTLDSAKEQLQAMRDKDQELRLQIAELEAELKAVRVAQTRSQFQLDNTRLSEIKLSLENLRTRVNAERYQVELEGEFTNPFPGDRTEKMTVRPVRDLAKEIKDTLEGSRVVNDQK